MWRLNKLVLGLICVNLFFSSLPNFSFGPVKRLNFHTFLKAIADDSSKKKSSLKTILFLGNSLTAGYNLDPTQAFPNLIQQKIDSVGWHFTAINAGLSGETSSGGLRRINWLFKRKIDILVLELGGNDVLRGIPLELTKKNLQAIMEQTRKKYPEVKIVIAGLQAPPNLGQEYTAQFRAIYSDLAERNSALLIPFLLKGVAGVAELNLPDRIHPTAEGHKMVAETVWQVLKPLLETINETSSSK